MKELLSKEFKLCVHPTCYIFLLMATMLLIPSYPLYVSFFYETLGIFFIFVTGRETQDVTFSALLPVAKQDVVKARTALIVCLELAVLILSIPFAILRANVAVAPNAAGTDPGVAFYGFSLIQFAIFNLIFIPGFYKTAYKAGKPFLVAAVVQFLYIGLVEASMFVVPYCKNTLDSTDASKQLAQLPVLCIGIGIYVLFSWLAYRQGAKNFDKVDL